VLLQRRSLVALAGQVVALEGVPFQVVHLPLWPLPPQFEADSPTRFDWIELTEKGLAGDERVDELGSANSSTIFSALQAIPGGLGVTTTEGPASAPAQIALDGNELIEDVYTGANTPNNLEGQIRHDVLVGFMAGYWDGRYGNDAIGFCSDPHFSPDFCPAGFNRPAFGDARAGLSPFPTCEQYAAVINQYADMYGNPYSDGASGKVTIPINKAAARTSKS